MSHPGIYPPGAPAPSFFDVGYLIDSLGRASGGVIKILSGDAGNAPVGTAWLITETLAVAPQHVLRSVDPVDIACEPDGNNASVVGASIVFLPSEDDPLGPSAPGLLRLSDTILDGHPFPLSPEVEAGRPAFLLHYPYGIRRVHVSIGTVLSVEDGILRHDGATAPGSSGGPILTSNGLVLGMTTTRDQRNASGPTLAAILLTLRGSEAWPEISAFHNLADLTSARDRLHDVEAEPPPATDPALLRAAVRWSFDPRELSGRARELLEPLVANPRAERWHLRSAERRDAIYGATLDKLRAARGVWDTGDDRQAVIDRILAGPPFSLDAIDAAVLPHWLQAVRWFAGVVDGLPAAGEVAEALERRRLRGRLTTVAGPDFQGRRDELIELHRWYDRDAPAPMLVTGIGGIGKSALVARFALGLPEETLLFWLDFDRADLAPDDADSIRSQLTGQLAVQAAADQPFPAALAGAAEGRPAPLLVLDGFEVAQYVRRYNELWPVLEEILREVPDLRVIVSGRAPVPGLRLLGAEARELPLGGLDRSDAATWLRQHDVSEPGALDRVLDLAAGIPLALHLAVRYVATGGDVRELPEHLPQAMVEGLLYTRILERVLDPAIAPIARDALVLRRLTVPIVAEVLGDEIPEDMSAVDVFATLTRELSLVQETGSEELRLRPEIRDPALTLLDVDNPQRVRQIDERAAAWYALQEPRDTAGTAELIYHRLRLGDVAGSARVWRASCAPFLADAGATLPPNARRWLNPRLTSQAAQQAAWEEDAYIRIFHALGRGLKHAVADILAERTARDPSGPLIFYDAWLHWLSAEPHRARATLADAGEAANDETRRARAVLGARLATETDDPASADRLLAGVAKPELWAGADGELVELLVWAARVHLTTALPAERALSDALDRFEQVRSAVEGFLHPMDVVLERLSTNLGPYHISAPRTPPANRDELQVFEAIMNAHRRTRPHHDSARDLIQHWAADKSSWFAPPEAYRHVGGHAALPQPVIQQALDLAVLGQRRLNLAVEDLSLRRVGELAAEGHVHRSPFTMSAVGALAAFRTLPLTFGRHNSIDRLLGDFLQIAPPLRRKPRADTWSIISAAPPDSDLRAALELYLLTPDPLEQLVRYVAGQDALEP